jgi:hypothetical protein
MIDLCKISVEKPAMQERVHLGYLDVAGRIILK